MEISSQNPAPASATCQASASAKSDEDLARLERVLAVKRAERIANRPETPEPTHVADALPRRPRLSLAELTPEQVAARDAELAAQHARQTAYERQARWRNFLGSGMAAYEHCTLDTYHAKTPEQEAVKAGVAEYLAAIGERFSAGEGLLLYGPSGTGKDHLAIAVVRLVIAAGFTAGRINGPEWFGDLRDLIGSERSERDEIAKLATPDFLLVSDPLPPIGALSQHQATMLYRVVVKRYEMQRPTIVTVNVSKRSEADERMGVAVWDRLKDRAWVMPCNWPSNRKPARVISLEGHDGRR